MGAASAVAQGINTAVGIYNTVRSIGQEASAKRALNAYVRQDLKNSNVYKNTQVSTLGADLKREEQARLNVSQIEALQGGGVRALVGGLGRVVAGSQDINNQIGVNLDEQQKEIDRLKASDEATIRAMQEQREQNDINALSSQISGAQQGFQTGVGQFTEGLTKTAKAYKDYKNSKVPKTE